MQQDQRVAAALAHWPELARQTGLSPEMPRANVLMYRQTASARRLVLRLETVEGRQAILKQELRGEPLAPDHFNECIAAQEGARLAMSGDVRGLRVPKCLAFLPDHGIALMDHFPGRTAATLVGSAPGHDGRRAALNACGRWLAEFHRSTSGGRRPYRTHFVLDYYKGLRARISAGDLRVAEPRLFLRLSQMIEQGADWWEGQPALHARRHGDYSLRNVLIGASTVAAIDFRPRQTGPIGHDVARLLIDFAALHGEHAKIPDGQILQGPYRAAFFQGYDLATSDDASVGFLAGVQILQDMLRIPADEQDRSLIQIVRLQGLIATAMRLFPNLRQE